MGHVLRREDQQAAIRLVCEERPVRRDARGKVEEGGVREGQYSLGRGEDEGRVWGSTGLLMWAWE